MSMFKSTNTVHMCLVGFPVTKYAYKQSFVYVRFYIIKEQKQITVIYTQ